MHKSDVVKVFVTAIGTDSGKTLVSAILCEALQADYWKPVQAGLPRDAETVRSLLSNRATVIHPERYLLNTPASPHAAAAIDNVKISLDDFRSPSTTNQLIIEGAGGLLVPLNDEDVIADLIPKVSDEVVLVANLYLGSINHTLLTIQELNRRKLKVRGIIFNGQENIYSEEFILRYSKFRLLLKIKPETEINKAVVKKYTTELLKNWNDE